MINASVCGKSYHLGVHHRGRLASWRARMIVLQDQLFEDHLQQSKITQTQAVSLTVRARLGNSTDMFRSISFPCVMEAKDSGRA